MSTNVPGLQSFFSEYFCIIDLRDDPNHRTELPSLNKDYHYHYDYYYCHYYYYYYHYYY